MTFKFHAKPNHHDLSCQRRASDRKELEAGPKNGPASETALKINGETNRQLQHASMNV